MYPDRIIFLQMWFFKYKIKYRWIFNFIFNKIFFAMIFKGTINIKHNILQHNTLLSLSYGKSENEKKINFLHKVLFN